MTGNDLIRTRLIDGGGPLFLRNPPHSEEATGYTVSPAVCANPECPCTTMGLRIQEVRRDPDGRFEIHGPHLFGEVSWDGSGLSLDADPEGGTPEGLIAWLQEKLGSERNREWLQERWRRSRGQVGDPKYPSGILPEDVEWMVSFFDVFPYEFDLTIVHENHPYLVEDLYCLHPGCGCDAVVIRFFDGSEGGEPIGLARTSARRRTPVEIEGPPLTKHLWDEFLSEFGHSVLRDHFKLMQSAAKPIRLPVRVPEPSVGRNAPCPCGSGKKFKRCCGA